MKDYQTALLDIIESFLANKLDGNAFEDAFTTIYDFEEPDNGIEGNNERYFELVRAYLTRFTSLPDDVREYPGFYMDEPTLKAKIIATKENIFDN
jgi:hypothetical protein